MLLTILFGKHHDVTYQRIIGIKNFEAVSPSKCMNRCCVHALTRGGGESKHRLFKVWLLKMEVLLEMMTHILNRDAVGILNGKYNYSF